MSREKPEIQTPADLLSEALMSSQSITGMIISFVKGNPDSGDTTVYTRWCGGTVTAMGLATNFLHHLHIYMEDMSEEDTE